MPSDPCQHHLLIIQDDAGRREFVLENLIYSIGSDQACDIRLNSQFVSRHHATLKLSSHPDGSFSYSITDGDSKGKPSANGLLINGRKLQADDLVNEDEIVFGPNVSATYLTLRRDAILTIPPDEFDITFADDDDDDDEIYITLVDDDDDDDDLTGGVAPVPRPWKPKPSPLTDGEATFPDQI